MKEFKLNLTYNDDSETKLRQAQNLMFYRPVKSIWQDGFITGGMYRDIWNVSSGSTVTVSSVDTEARVVTFYDRDGSRQISRAELERLYPRNERSNSMEALQQSQALIRRSEHERREAQREADRARLEEERLRQRRPWERFADMFR